MGQTFQPNAENRVYQAPRGVLAEYDGVECPVTIAEAFDSGAANAV